MMVVTGCTLHHLEYSYRQKRKQKKNERSPVCRSIEIWESDCSYSSISVTYDSAARFTTVAEHFVRACFFV